MNPRDKATEVEPGEDEVDPAEEARRLEDDVRANKGIGRTVQPQRNAKPRKTRRGYRSRKRHKKARRPSWATGFSL